MQLSLQTFSQLVQNAAAAVQSAAAQLLDLTVGSTLRAVLEANASIGLWLQWLIVLVLQTTRASTSTGSDLDTWFADFGFARLPAGAASGTVTFARYVPTLAATIPVGALVRTSDGTQTFVVIAEPRNAAYSTGTNAYVLASGQANVIVPVLAQAPGSAGNVLAGTVSLIVSTIVGVDTVSNPGPMTGGVDAESDAAARLRFHSFLDTRSRATTLAIEYAVQGVQQGLTYLVQENVDAGGNARMGNFVVTIDDGSGSPSATLLQSAAIAIQAVRPIGSTFSVQPPQVLPLTISATLTVAVPTQKPSAIAAVSAALQQYVNALPVGTGVSLTRIAQIAYAASPEVTNVTQILINGVATDIVPASTAVCKLGAAVLN